MKMKSYNGISVGDKVLVLKSLINWKGIKRSGIVQEIFTNYNAEIVYRIGFYEMSRCVDGCNIFSNTEYIELDKISIREDKLNLILNG
jgi:hypothetical protein